MKKAMLITVVLFASLLGGYLSPYAGITILLLLTVLLFLRVGHEIEIGKDSLLSLLFACWAVISSLYAADRWGAILFSGSLVAGSFFYLTLRNSSEWEIPLLKTVVIGGCIVSSCETLRQVNLLQQGLFYNPNPFSGFLTPLVPIAFYLYSRFRKNIYLIGSTLLVFANFISASRSGIATMMLASVAIALLFCREKDRGAVKALILVLFAGFCSFLLFSLVKDTFVMKQTVGILEKQPTNLIQRAYLLKITFQVIREAPFLGHGLNSFLSVMNTLSNPYVVEPSIHAHSLYLNIMAEVGIIGLCLFVCFLIMIMKGPFYTSFLLKVALLAFLFHNIVEYNFPPPPFQVLFYLLCAAIMRGKRHEAVLLHVRGRTARIIPACLAFYFILVHLFPVMGITLLGKANAAIQRQGTAKALTYFFVSTYFGYSVSSVHLDTAHVLTNVYFSSGAENTNFLKIAEKNYLKALYLDKLNGRIYTDIAGFYACTGRPREGEAYLYEIVRMYPYHHEYRLTLARFLAAHGRSGEAIEILQESNAFLTKYAPLNPMRVNILAGLAQLYASGDERARAEDFLAKARRLKQVLEVPDRAKKESNVVPPH